jgi:hypothetical protein
MRTRLPLRTWRWSGFGALALCVLSGAAGADVVAQSELLASDGAAHDEFGRSVGVSGDTLVASSPWADVGSNSNQGAAYVFVRSGSGWTQQVKLTASDGAAQALFGYSVAVSGDTAVVGALAAGSDQRGNAYVFTRSGATWTQQAQLTPSDAAGSDSFGVSVAIQGDTVVVGASVKDVGSTVDQGAAYVFTRSGSTWTQQAKLTASDGAAGDEFGTSVAIDGDAVVVGAFADDVASNSNQGSAYVFRRSGSAWTQEVQLTASDGAGEDRFGVSVAVFHDDVVVGAYLDDAGSNTNQGAAYVFCRGVSSWSQQAKLAAPESGSHEWFGFSVALSKDVAVVGHRFDGVGSNAEQGSARVFTRLGTTWTQRAVVVASDGAADDQFGTSVAVSGEVLVVGATRCEVGSAADQGRTYVFAGLPAQQAELHASDGAAHDEFGRSVGVSGDTLIAGSPFDDVGSNSNQGSAYVYVRSGSAWAQQAKLVASDAAANSWLGYSAAVSGDTAVAGALAAGEDQRGYAYVFTRSGSTWSQQARLTAADAADSDSFGLSVAVDGDTIVVGASVKDVGSNVDQGAVYVFTRSGSTWTQQAKLTASDGASGDEFGTSVAIDGDSLIVGAFADDVGSNSNQGSAYVFTRSGTSWTQQARLTAGDGATEDRLGIGVAIDGDVAAVGAFLDDVGSNTNQGSAYVFRRSGSSWSQETKLTDADGSANEWFGFSVAVSGNVVAVGHRFDGVGSHVGQGSARVFGWDGSAWTLRAVFVAANGAADDQFGTSVAMSGDLLAVGTPRTEVGSNEDQGTTYVYSGVLVLGSQ